MSSDRPARHRLRATGENKHHAHEPEDTQVKRVPGKNLPHALVEEKARKIKESKDWPRKSGEL